MGSVLQSVQQFAADELAADSLFASANLVPLVERKGDLQKEIATALQQLGLAAMVLTVAANSERHDARGVYFEEIFVTVAIGEKVLLNKSGVGAAELAERALAALKGKNVPGQFEPMVAAKPTLQMVTPPRNLAALDILYHCNLKTSGGIRLSNAPTCADPTFDPDGGATPATLSLACATPGAAIWFTTDGSLPSPGNPSAQLFTGPAPITEPCVVRARSGAWGFLASRIIHRTFT